MRQIISGGACDRADARVTHCRRELHRFTCHGTDLAEAIEHQARRLRKYRVRYWHFADIVPTLSMSAFRGEADTLWFSAVDPKRTCLIAEDTTLPITPLYQR